MRNRLKGNKNFVKHTFRYSDDVPYTCIKTGIMRYLDPINNLTFRKVFGEHPRLLKSFLNAMLPLSVPIKDLEYLPAELVPEVPLLKFSKYPNSKLLIITKNGPSCCGSGICQRLRPPQKRYRPNCMKCRKYEKPLSCCRKVLTLNQKCQLMISTGTALVLSARCLQTRLLKEKSKESN